MDPVQQLLKALELFSDWTISLLILTVAAIGWVVANREKFSRMILLRGCLACLGLSTLFAVMTLALVPQVAESLNLSSRSIYAIEPAFYLVFGEFIRVSWVKFAYVVWPQHILFLAGVGLFIWGTVERRARPRPPEASAPVPSADDADHHRKRHFDPNA